MLHGTTDLTTIVFRVDEAYMAESRCIGSYEDSV